MTIYNNFSKLCAVLLESSTANALIKNSPGSQQVIRAMHANFKLGHNVNWQPGNLKFGEIKDMAGQSKHAYVLLVGERGSAGIVYVNRYMQRKPSSYAVIASDGGEAEELKSGASKDISALIKQVIGRVQATYVTYQSVEKAAATVLRKNRADNKTQPTGYVDPNVTLEANAKLLLNKFRPLWLKAIQAATADMKGVVVTMIKNDAFDAANKKLNKLKKLEKLVHDINHGGDTEDLETSMGKFLTYSLYMTASHFYPDLTGEVSGSPNAGYYSRDLSVQSTDGVKKIIADIAAGDNTKLSAILAFFKRGLMS